MSLAATVVCGTANAETVIGFDSLVGGEVVSNQFLDEGVLFDSLRVSPAGLSGVDGAASEPNTVLPQKTGPSIFDGKTPSMVTEQYDVEQRHGFGEKLSDVLFFSDVDGIELGTTDVISLLVGFDFLNVGGNEVNRVLIEAFDLDYKLIHFEVSMRLVSENPSVLSILAPGIHGVRVTQSDGVTFDDFRFAEIYPVPVCILPEGPASDFDGNGVVDFGDFLLLSQHFGKDVYLHSSGDADCSGEVDFSDFLTLSSEFGGVAAVSVPEVGTRISFWWLYFGIWALNRERSRQ